MNSYEFLLIISVIAGFGVGFILGTELESRTWMKAMDRLVERFRQIIRDDR